MPSSREYARPRPLLRQYIGLSVVAYLIVCALLYFFLWTTRDAAIREAKNSTRDVNGIFAEHIERIFASIYWLSDSAASAYREHGRDLELLRRELERINAKEDYSLQLAVIDASGIFVASNVSSESGTDLRDRDHIRAHLDGSVEIYISRPLVGRVSNKASINITRAIRTREGTLAGIIVVSYDPTMLDRFFERHARDPGGVIALARLDGTVLARSRDAARVVGRNLGQSPLFSQQLARGVTRGHLSAESPVDGVRRIYHFHVLDRLPLVVIKGASYDSVLAEHTTQVMLTSGLLVVLLFSLIAGGVLVAKLERQHDLAARARRSEQEAHRLAELLQSTFQSTGILALIFDRKHALSFANDSAKEIISLHDSKSDPVTLLIGDVATHGHEKPFTVTRRLQLPDGRSRTFFWTIARAAWVAEDARVAIGFDRTEIEAAENALYQKARLTNLGEMSTGLAHELAQPLTVISFSAAMLAKCAGPQALEHLNLLAASTQRVRETVDRMKAFGRRTTLRSSSRFFVRDSVETIALLTRNDLMLAGIRLVLDESGSETVAMGDPVLFEQVLLNLVLNARDAIESVQPSDAERAERRIEIAFGEREGGGRVYIRVSDNGPGVGEGLAERIFEPFFTTKPNGSGLGLSLSYGIVSDLGGSISVTSSGRGATFEVELPSGMAGSNGSSAAVRMPVPLAQAGIV
jgi:C4-dicarboxylate-specific signal transduction histidine kinase